MREFYYEPPEPYVTRNKKLLGPVFTSNNNRSQQTFGYPAGEILFPSLPYIQKEDTYIFVNLCEDPIFRWIF